MNYYVQALSEETEDYQAAIYGSYPQSTKDVGTTSKEANYSYGGQSHSFALYDQIKAKYNMVTELEDFIEITGFTRWTSDPRYNNGVALNDSSSDGTINMYYTRNKYTIHYISQGPNVTDRSEKQDDRIYYEASLAPYGMQNDGSWYYEPTNGKDGYFFAGWYEDEACTVPYDFNTQMPANDVTVYAKWDTQRVRVVLVPTKDNAHNAEVQMANNQALTFRLDYKEQVSDENIKSGVIKRTGYRLVGWYTSPTFEENTLWNFNTEVSKEVPAVNMDYQSSTNADWINNTYGDNDGAHENVRGILKLYAKWELTVDENSVYVEYDVPEEYCVYDSQGNLQTTIPVDETAYVLTDDYITTTVKPAPTGYADGFKFAGWQLLNSDGSEASDVNPFAAGSTQTLDKAYIEERTITDDYGHAATIKVIHLKAKFDVDEENVATMVTFDGNGGVTNDAAQDDRVTEAIQVNKTFTIPEAGDFIRKGYTQVGWSFDSTMTAEQFKTLIEQNTVNGIVDYDALAHLGVFEMGETVAADNKFLTVINNWDPLKNTIYAVWDPIPVDVTIHKIDATNESFLEGAEFKILTGSGEEVKHKVDEVEEIISVFTVNNSYTIEGMYAGSYQIWETKSPDGYNLSSTVIKFDVGVDEDGYAVITFSSDNTATNCSIGNRKIIIEEVEKTKNDVLVVSNAPGVSLPSTGGIGSRTVIYAGAAVLLLTTAAFVWRRRKIEEN